VREPTQHADALDVPSLEPISPSERIHVLDLLRGFTMFGVLWSNLNDWYGYVAPVTSLDHGLAWMQLYMIEGRFYTLLALLFGIGFGIQLIRAEERGVEKSTVYMRRFTGLLVLGAVHGFLIASVDILMFYAFAGFALVLFRTISTRGLIIAVLLCRFAIPEVIKRVRIITDWSFSPPAVTEPTREWILAHGSWLQIEAIRVATIIDKWNPFTNYLFFGILTLFLLGLWVSKSGYLKSVVENPRTTWRLLFGALIVMVIGLVWEANYIDVRNMVPWLTDLRPNNFEASDFRFWIPTQWIWSSLYLSTEAMAIVYASVLILLSQYSSKKRLFWPLAATGRMALTTYITQSIVVTILFFGYGFGWYDSVGLTGKFAITLILFSCQMAASVWWLNRYRFGPLEWLWRAMTYGYLPKLRLEEKPVS